MKIGVTGFSGRLGSDLVTNWNCVPMTCNIISNDQILDSIDTVHPDVIINCAAETNVDGCEDIDDEHSKYGKNALLVNFRGVENLQSCFSGPIIHISTDYVFSGKKGPYKENDNDYPPVNVYGWTKWAGEVVLLTPRIHNSMVVRTTGLFGTHDDDFVHKLLNVLQSDTHIQSSTELCGNSTYIPFLSRSLLYVAHNLDKFKDHPILHIASTDIVSRYSLSLMVCKVFDLDANLVHPCKNSDITGWVAPRPINAGLNVRLSKKLGLQQFSVLDGLRRMKIDLNL